MILTIGHSNRTLPALVELLRAHRVEQVVDVRRHPHSRRNPQFDREALARELPAAGIAYRHDESLGGMRDPVAGSPHTALEEPRMRGFADHMESREFAESLARLERLGQHGVTALLCAEADPARCHRSMIADALVARGVAVEHILDLVSRAPHRLAGSAAKVGDRLVYAAAQRRLDLEGA